MGKYDFNFDLYEESTLAWIAQSIDPNTVVLEFGAANGRLTKFLNQEKGCQVDIVEIDESSGSEAAYYAKQAWIGLEKGDIEKYHWGGVAEQYDYIVFADVLEHLRNPEECLKRCKFILKRTGRIFVSVPNISHNSIIIELLNDRFNYTPIGLLDNTHLKFFTRQSFIQMAESAGWAVIGERAKYIRVGENEINNSYKDVPKEVFKYLINRDSGDIYQYLFTLANSSEYLIGNCERTVLLDGASHYWLQANYAQDGEYSYKKESTIHINPYTGFIDVSLTIPSNTSRVLIKPLNCCCIVQNLNIQVSAGEQIYSIKDFKHNAWKVLENSYYFKNIPEIEVKLSQESDALQLKMDIVKYDFEDPFLYSLVEEIENYNKRISEICSEYEIEIQKKDLEFRESADIYEREILQKDKEFQKSVDTYEGMIQNKDDQFRHSVETYEEVIRKKDAEFHQSVEAYESVIRQKDLEFQKSVETYEKMIHQKDEEFKNSVNTYEKVIREKEIEFQKQLEKLEASQDNLPSDTDFHQQEG